MPMRAELYCVEWKELAFFIKESNFWQCQSCQTQCLRPGESCNDLTRAERTRRTLSVAHVDHDYTSPEIFVAALCMACHLAHDHAYHLQNRKPARRWNYRHTKQKRAGQLGIFQEGKLAA